MSANENISRYLDFSGGLQTASSRLLMKDNELVKATNTRYDKKLGGVTRRSGYEILGYPVSDGKSILGMNSYSQKDGNNKLLVSANNSGGTYNVLSYYNNPIWSSVLATLSPSTELEFENFMDKAFVVGFDSGTNTFIPTITVDRTLATSTSSDVYNAPRGKFISKYQDMMYVSHCWVNGKYYPNRAYRSSTPTDSITYVNGDFKGIVWQIEVDSARYLKAGMVIDIYKENSNQKKVDSLTIISVNKDNNTITFAPTNIDIADRDEIYLEDKKGTLGLFWNTDYPNPESSDFLEIPAVRNEIPHITGVSSNNNRKLFFTEHSLWKWDGANLVNVSGTIGTTSHKSIKETSIGTIFLHKTGWWLYNDANGQLQIISRGIQNYVDAINQPNFYKAVAMSLGDEYKCYVGTLSEVDSRTTSTSTSSTSTSSTSSSTSSTSTSSTSTSSTSTSSTTTTTSTSSTSSSTSSTSSSTSSTSSSTSSTSQSTSTSTTTLATGTTAQVFVYNTATNSWAVDELDRNITSSVVHTMHGYEKNYFGDSQGRVFRDGVGLTDNGRPIQLLIETKRFHLNLPEETKKFRRIYVYTQKGQGAMISYSLDDKEFQTLGQLGKNVTSFELSDIEGRDIAFRVSQNNGGESVIFIGVAIVWLRGDLYATN